MVSLYVYIKTTGKSRYVYDICIYISIKVGLRFFLLGNDFVPSRNKAFKSARF